jgi:AcrR family transcriptional regulator
MSPRTPQKFQEMRDEKKTLIMDVALQHFASEGFFSTTINHIAKHAGISKGLMYNYFESKEALLEAIVHRSVNEIFNYFDIDRDGYLSENEFEYFIRRIDLILKEKRSFWRLLIQLLSQNDAREQLFKTFPGSGSLAHPGHEPGDNQYPGLMMKMIKDYFLKKKEKMSPDYDPSLEMELFLITLKGFAVTSVYADENAPDNNEKVLNRIIELFK